MTSNTTLSHLARHYGFGDRLLLAPLEISKGMRQNQNLHADAFEAYVGALFKDYRSRGIVQEAKAWVDKLYSFDVFPDVVDAGQRMVNKFAEAGRKVQEDKKRRLLGGGRKGKAKVARSEDLTSPKHRRR